MMSIEHVFAMKMKEMYEHYTVRTQQRIVHQLSDKVRFTRNSLKEKPFYSNRSKL